MVAILENDGQKLEGIKKWRPFKMAEIKGRLALIENNSRRHTVLYN